MYYKYIIILLGYRRRHSIPLGPRSDSFRPRQKRSSCMTSISGRADASGVGSYVRRLAVWLAGLAALSVASQAFAEVREFNITIEEVTIQVAPDLKYQVFAFNGQVPGPLIHVKQGDDIIAHVTNNTTLPHTILWHGQYQHNNWQMDGVPGVTQKAIEPGDTFTYKFKAEMTGSTWFL